MMNTSPVSDTPSPATAETAKNQVFSTEHIKADLGKKTVRGGAVTVVYQVLKQVLAIGETVVLSRLLLPEQSGLVNMVIVVTGFITLFNDLGLSSATIQREELDHDKVNTLFWINVAMGIVLALITAGLAPVIAWFYGEPRLIPLTLVIALGFVFGGLTVQHRALLKRQLRISSMVKIDLIETVIGILTGIIVALLLPQDQRHWAIVASFMVQMPVDIIGLWIMCRWRPSRPAIASGIRSMLMFGGNLTGFQIINYLSRNVDNLLIGKFYGATSVGLYNKAYGLLLLPLRRVNTPISAVAVPALSRLVDEPNRYRHAYKRISSITCILTMPLVACMMMESDWLIPFMFGRQWSAASPMFTLLCISGMVEPFTYTAGWLFVSQGRGREQFHWGLFGTTLTIVGIVAGLPWGPIGVASGYSIAGIIRTPLLFWYVGRNGLVTTRDMYRGIAPFVFTSAAILVALGLLQQVLPPASQSTETQLFINLVIATLLAGVVALITLAIQPAGRSALKELKNIPQMLMKRK
ncbi:MAG TPA: lipopolysaccharide biosynthesis protein [Roseiflexaceae bacterium]|jgi:PST family polysaccharide transporter|nr:lipopolysaccharide biosynthesis protein [Roseiflexaceae bacterium]